MTERKADRWYYSFLPFNVAGGSTSPLIPLFITEGLAGNVAQVGIISAISSLASVPANIIWGNLSEHDLDWLFRKLPPAGLAIITVVSSPEQAGEIWHRCFRS